MLAIAAAACAPAAGAPTWTYTPGGASGAGSGSATPAPTQGGTASGDVLGVLEVNAVDLGFEPRELSVEKAGTYEVRFNNNGVLPHDVTFADGSTSGTVNGGATATVKVNVPEGGLTFICSVPGHADAGMQGAITVAGSTAGGSGSDDHGGPAPAADVQPDPNAPPPVLYPADAPALLAGDVHDFDLVIEEKLMTVAYDPKAKSGFVQAVWTFNGTVPGPVIRVKVGDTIRIHLKNPATNQLAHSVDFHASQVAWNDEMTSINPGEEKVYEWRADYAGVWMYHCGTSPALHHIANGMYGMVIVEPKEGLPPVDAEFALVQNEWYLGPQGEPVSLSKAAAGAPAPDYVAFNGVANQYLNNPIQVGTGERVRVFVLNAGPSIDSSFHVVGTIFSSVIKEGVRLDVGNPGNYGAQAVDLSPAQGAIIEFEMPEDGLYPIVTHAFNFVGRGALGLFQAGDGDPKN
ncbi:MAG TPA: multicopper oxidase domain-containing protein [Candidatus Sulfomarinibacteraceae bacterium]|nr:multicopper oxidase domain-containing protein [Candidatus Sulfomarinibacteraceae bacterium]